MEATGTTCSVCISLGFNFESTACGLCGKELQTTRGTRVGRGVASFANDQSLIAHPACNRKISPIIRSFRDQVGTLFRTIQMPNLDKNSLHTHLDHAQMIAFREMRPHLAGKSVIAYFSSNSAELIQCVGIKAAKEYAASLTALKSKL